MNKCARQLDQSLVKRAIGPVPVFEPKLFQNIVRLVKLPAIEAVKVTLIKGINSTGDPLAHHARDSFGFVAHP